MKTIRKPDNQEIYESALRQDFLSFAMRAFREIYPGTPFVPNWHLEAITWHLQNAISGIDRHLVINIAPRQMKSFIVSVAWVAWLLGNFPHLKIMCVSYSDDLARKHARDCRNIMKSRWFRDVFPPARIREEKSAENDFETNKGGGRFSGSMQGSLTGRGCDILIIDDPSKADEIRHETERQRVREIYDNTLFSRLNDKPKGVVVLVMQRLHEADLSGYLLEKGDFLHLSYPSIAVQDETIKVGMHTEYHRLTGAPLNPARENLADLERIRKTVGSLVFETQYQQNPVPADGAMFRREWLFQTDRLPELENFDAIICSWDLANKSVETSDYSVGTVWGRYENRYYLLDVFRGRQSYSDLKTSICALARRYGSTTILIEDAGIGPAMKDDLSRETSHAVILQKVTNDKETRAVPVAALFEAGRVVLLSSAPWFGPYINELLSFPQGKYDDQVDSTTQCLNWFRNRIYEDDIPVVPIQLFLKTDDW